MVLSHKIIVVSDFPSVSTSSAGWCPWRVAAATGLSAADSQGLGQTPALSSGTSSDQPHPPASRRHNTHTDTHHTQTQTHTLPVVAEARGGEQTRRSLSDVLGLGKVAHLFKPQCLFQTSLKIKRKQLRHTKGVKVDCTGHLRH